MKAIAEVPPGNKHWLWMLPVFLLTTVLTVPLLDYDAFHHDEAYSMIAAGINRSGPHSFADVWSAIYERSAEQALGWPLLLSAWVQFVGWSEVAARAIPFFGGTLAMAMFYRTGRMLFNRSAGLFACLLLAGSAFFLAFFSIARAFSLVALLATLTLFCYWRIALQRGSEAGRGFLAGYTCGNVGLLYMHYFGALLLPSLLLFHLLFVPKKRQWWKPVVLTGLALLVASLQLPVFLYGLERSVSNSFVNEHAMNPAEILQRFVRFLSNGQISPSLSAGWLLFVLVLLLLLFLTIRIIRSSRLPGPKLFLAFTALSLLALTLAANEVVRVLMSNRIRYLIILWPLTALLAGGALQRFSTRHRALVTGLLAFWLIIGAHTVLANRFRYRVDYLQRSDIHHMYRIMRERASEADFLILDYDAEQRDPGRVYTRSLGLPYKIIYRDREEPLRSVMPVHEDYTWAWMFFRLQDQEFIEPLARELGRYFWDHVYDGWGYTLERHALSPAHCPESPERIVFDRNIWMAGPDVRVEDGSLSLFAGLGSQDDYLLAHYSLAVHVIDPRSGERVAQGDVGVGPGSFVPVRSDVDISALPAGAYEVQVALYDWQTGGRLDARDLATGEVSDMHVLHRFETNVAP